MVAEGRMGCNWGQRHCGLGDESGEKRVDKRAIQDVTPKLSSSFNGCTIFEPLLYLCFDVVYYTTRPHCLSFAGQFCLSHSVVPDSTRKKWESHKGMVSQMCVTVCVNMLSKVYIIDPQCGFDRPGVTGEPVQKWTLCQGHGQEWPKKVTNYTSYSYRQLLLVEKYVLAFAWGWAMPSCEERSNSKREPGRKANDM